MSDQKMVSEKDAVLREREAFENGCLYMVRRFDIDVGLAGGVWDGTSPLAAEKYPLPKVTRDRVVLDPFGQRHQGWTLYKGEIMRTTRSIDGKVVELRRCCDDKGTGNWLWWVPNEKRLAVWADLLANPTEEVDAD